MKMEHVNCVVTKNVAKGAAKIRYGKKKYVARFFNEDATFFVPMRSSNKKNSRRRVAWPFFQRPKTTLMIK